MCVIEKVVVKLPLTPVIDVNSWKIFDRNTSVYCLDCEYRVFVLIGKICNKDDLYILYLVYDVDHPEITVIHSTQCCHTTFQEVVSMEASSDY
ncbi:hypothetical protein HHI36_020278 [Cryptolaemus montrouzieri]|uniref:Uncharacterized protein n=1 Tax=Cryptolaemus montrouzieri TaxID=559131 RepID=A0ABD2NAF4_9CUCU